MGWRERLGARRQFRVSSRIRTRFSVKRGVRGHFIKEIQDLAIDWVENECYTEESKMDLTFYA